jgi:hypothetical protein
VDTARLFKEMILVILQIDIASAMREEAVKVTDKREHAHCSHLLCTHEEECLSQSEHD